MSPTLWHRDIRAPNIFVHQDRVAGLIDWQDTWVGPLFFQARQPRLVNYSGELMMKLPESYDALEDESEKRRLRSQVEKSNLLWKYETESKEKNPILHDRSQIKQSLTRRDAVDFAVNTWDEDIIPFRECLIRIARYV